MSNSISRLKQQSFRRVGRNKSIFKKSTDATSSFAFSHKSIKEVNETNTVQVLSTPMGKRQSNLKAQEQSPLIIESPDAGIIAKSQTNVKGTQRIIIPKQVFHPIKRLKDDYSHHKQSSNSNAVIELPNEQYYKRRHISIQNHLIASYTVF